MKVDRVVLTFAAVLLAGCGERPAQDAAVVAAGAPRPAAAAPPPAPAEAPVTYRVPAGAVLRVRTAASLSTAANSPGDRFEATLAAALVRDGEVLAARGARVFGRITEARPSGRLKGRAILGVTVDTVEVNGILHRVETSTVERLSAAHKKRNMALIGGGAGVGALVGALAGGGKGAAIGAAAGAGAGTAGAALTGVKHARIPAESLLSFTLRTALVVTLRGERSGRGAAYGAAPSVPL
jgi:hypothetical protein